MDNLKKEITSFVKARDWEKYHSPKNLAMGLSIEASELLEIFLWLSDHESQNLNAKQLKQLKDEIGDVMIYLINLSTKFDFDLIECAKDKLKQNKEKYPIELVKGSAKKYTEY